VNDLGRLDAAQIVAIAQEVECFAQKPSERRIAILSPILGFTTCTIARISGLGV